MYTALGGGGGLFQKFGWMPDEFELCIITFDMTYSGREEAKGER